uniref:Major capsid protein n=1 Tax=Pithovirus LCPAC102 TaxID=2506587 RepID=A0A4D5XF97_9VIRU|nr:MAG: major capsid protein [Pithovirus LCPAC102]
MSSETFINVAKLELDSLTEFQKELHNESDIDEEVSSSFTYNFIKSTWSTLYTEKLNPITREKQAQTAEYELNTKFHYARKVYATIDIPSYKIKSKYDELVEIAPCNNIFHNIIEECTLSTDGENIQTLNTVSLDNYAQFDMPPGAGKRRLHKKMIGDRNIYGKWSTGFNSMSLECILPFDYTSHIKKAIPLFLCSSSMKISHIFKFNTRLSHIIRMRVRKSKEDDWTYIKYNHIYMHDVKHDESLDFPDIWAKYSYLTNEEIEWRRENQHSIYYEDIIIKHADINTIYGKPVTLNIQSPYPVKSIRWGSINMNSIKLNTHSNYTTNINDINKGFNPTESFELRYGNSYRVQAMNYKHHSRIEPFYSTMSAPYDEGYNCLNLTNNIYHIYPDGGIVFHMGNIQAKFNINNTDPNLLLVEDQKIEVDQDLVFKELDANYNKTNNISSPEFKVYIMLTIIRKVIFEYKKPVKLENNKLAQIEKIDKQYSDSY